jgi:hypothetical protein
MPGKLARTRVAGGDDVLVRSPADLPELPRHLPDFRSIKTPPSDFELVLREEVLEPLVEHDVLDRQIQSAAIDKPLEPEMEIGAVGWVHQSLHGAHATLNPDHGLKFPWRVPELAGVLAGLDQGSREHGLAR